MRRILGLLAALLLISAATAAAQQPTPPAAPSATISVFLDCPNVFCDEDYMRTEIKAVNWVRDRAVADVHILVTGQDTGAGGRELSCSFIGLRGYAGLADTLKFSLPPAFTDDDRRVALARTFRSGLVRYVARTPNAAQITISLGAGSANAEGQVSTKADPWKAWVFRTSMGSYVEGEETQQFFNLNGRFSANRITENWKTKFSASQNYSQSRFEIDSVTVEKNIRRNYYSELVLVKAISSHWSAGVRSDFSSSTYDNTKRQVRIAPAVEYNIFPYSQSTRRVIKFEYAVGVANVAYADTTIYDKVRETLPLHRLSSGVAVRQPWGSVDVSMVATQYLHDLSKYRIGSFAGLSVRPFKSFEIYTYGNYEMIYDQLSLQKKSYTPQQILLRQFQRGTKYRFWMDFGVAYTFGSIYNNVVNPRFD